MRPTLVSLVLTLVVAFLLIPASEAAACSCENPGPPCQNTFRVDAVFTGSVVNITALPIDGPPLPPGAIRMGGTLRVDFSIDQAFRGVQGSTVSVLTSAMSPACGYEFKQGERYLVYAYGSKDGTELRTSICSRTRHISEANEDLQFLQSLSTKTTDARILGTVQHYEPNLSGGDTKEPDHVPNVLVTARGEGLLSNARTDAQGRYELPLPPGSYEVAVELLPRFAAERSTQTVELRDPRACAVVDFYVRFDGRIKGSVRLVSGDPAQNVPVEAMLAERVGAPGIIETLRATTTVGGSFEFTEVPPGRYVVGVDLIRRMDPTTSFPATFHPGTPDASLATVVELEGGDQIQLDPMTLPRPRRPFRLTGTVEFADGRPAAGVFVALRDGAATWRQVAVGIRTNADGGFSFAVHDGLSYIISASYWDEAQRKGSGGNLGPILVTGDAGPLKVVLADK